MAQQPAAGAWTVRVKPMQGDFDGPTSQPRLRAALESAPVAPEVPHPRLPNLRPTVPTAIRFPDPLEVIEGGLPGPNEPPAAAGSADRTKTTTSTPVEFRDDSTDGDGWIASWPWDFGDGTTSSSQNPVHTFAKSGANRVTLQVTDDRGATDWDDIGRIRVRQG